MPILFYKELLTIFDVSPRAKSFLKPNEINIRVLCHFWNDLVYKDKMCKTDDDFGDICVACARVFISPGEISFKTGAPSKGRWVSVRHEMALALAMRSMTRKQKQQQLHQQHV